MAITDPNVKIPIILEMVYPVAWLEEKAEGDPECRNNREIQTKVCTLQHIISPVTQSMAFVFVQHYLRRHEITRPQTFIGSVSQMLAGLTHNVTPARLASISSSIPKVMIVTGDQDNLVAPENSAYLAQHMKEAEYIVFEETGHAIHAQRKKRYNALLQRVFSEGREKAVNIGASS